MVFARGDDNGVTWSTQPLVRPIELEAGCTMRREAEIGDLFLIDAGEHPRNPRI